MSSINTEAKNRRFVLIIVAIVVAIALVISGVLVWRSNNSKDSQPQTATVTSSATANSDKKKNAGKNPRNPQPQRLADPLHLTPRPAFWTSR